MLVARGTPCAVHALYLFVVRKVSLSFIDSDDRLVLCLFNR
jgi:hypothetical protein